MVADVGGGGGSERREEMLFGTQYWQFHMVVPLDVTVYYSPPAVLPHSYAPKIFFGLTIRLL